METKKILVESTNIAKSVLDIMNREEKISVHYILTIMAVATKLVIKSISKDSIDEKMTIVLYNDIFSKIDIPEKKVV